MTKPELTFDSRHLFSFFRRGAHAGFPMLVGVVQYTKNHPQYLAQALLQPIQQLTCKQIQQDAEPGTVGEMVSFLYTGKLDDNIKNYVPLLTLADRYGVDVLVQKCCEVLLDKVCADSVLTITRTQLET